MTPTPEQAASHVYAIRAAGFTRIPAQVTGSWLDELRELTDRALAAAMRVYQSKGKLKHTAMSEGYQATRCLYCWGDAALRLIDLDIIHVVAGDLLGDYKLWDVSALSVIPIRPDRNPPAGDFHRDKHPVDTRVAKPPYLWCFVCLDDTTPQNGATWVVPGSHHVATPQFASGERLQSFAAPISQQLCASAGDLIMIDPTTLHSAGQNRTGRPRRLVNVGLCSAGTPPLLDHWAIAGPALRSRATDRVRQLMTSDAPGLDQTWDALPQGWESSQ